MSLDLFTAKDDLVDHPVIQGIIKDLREKQMLKG